MEIAPSTLLQIASCGRWWISEIGQRKEILIGCSLTKSFSSGLQIFYRMHGLRGVQNQTQNQCLEDGGSQKLPEDKERS